MDKIDEKLLLELDQDPRASFTQLGKAARISKESAQYRVKHLPKNGILGGFYAFVGVSQLGRITHKTLIKYKSVTADVQKQIIEYVSAYRYIIWAGYCEGTWDLIITTMTPSTKEYVEFFGGFFTKFGSYFRQKEVLVSVAAHIFNDKFLSEGKLLYAKVLDLHAPEEEVDGMDQRIMTEISLNSRATFTEMGKKIGLSYWAVAQRYKRLVERKLILLLKPRVEFRTLGYSYYHILIELNNEAMKEKLVAYYTRHKDCILVMTHVGFYSLHLEFVLRPEEMKGVIIDLREKFGNDIMSYEPLLIQDEYVMNLLR